MKRKCNITLLFFSLIAVFVTEIKFIYSNYVNDDITSSLYKMTFQTRTDVEDYLNEIYQINHSHSIYRTGEGALSVYNVNQSLLSSNYNSLGSLRLDLNNDEIVNDLDNIGSGTCQITAAAMLVKYLELIDIFNYSPKINSDSNDVNNIYYELVTSYNQSFGWTTGGTNHIQAVSGLNHLFSKYDTNLTATYTTNSMDFLAIIKNCDNLRTPLIAHYYSQSNNGHAVTVCGYFQYNVSYKVSSLSSTITDYHYFAIVCDGWSTTNPNNFDYDLNYSFIRITDIAQLIYFY